MTAARLLVAGALAGALAAGPAPGVAAGEEPAVTPLAAVPAAVPVDREAGVVEREAGADVDGAARLAIPDDPMPLGVLGYIERVVEAPPPAAGPSAGEDGARPAAAGPGAPDAAPRDAMRTARLEPREAPRGVRDGEPAPTGEAASGGLANTAPEAAERPDHLVVLKGPRLLLLFHGERLLRYYPVALGSEPFGAKASLGDGRTPEGLYRIAGRNPHSRFHRALRISYPNARDRARAEATGQAPGGSIMIHGLPNGLGSIGADHTAANWTDGCIAVTNEEIDELWELVDDGTPIQILP